MGKKGIIKDSKREIFVCACNSLEHTYSIWYESDYNQLYLEPVLSVSNNFLIRMWTAIKYVFGYKSVYGMFDNLLINVDDMPNIIEYMNTVISEDINRENKRNKKISDDIKGKEKKYTIRTEGKN